MKLRLRNITKAKCCTKVRISGFTFLHKSSDFRNGFISTDIYAKPTDSHLYLSFSSSHPSHCKRAVPFGVALRIKRNCSTNDFLQNRCKEYKGYLKSQNYPAGVVDKQLDKALKISRSELLCKKVKPDKKVFPLVLDYNPDIQKVIRKHFHLLESSPEVKEIFPSKSIFPTYRRTKNLKEMLAPSKFRVTSCRNQRKENRGCSKCNKKCDLCKNYLIEASKFQSSATGRHYPIQQKLSCSSQNVIYLATCAKCNLQYVGSTSTEFKVRFRNHKSNMLKNKRTCELASTLMTLNMKFHKSISSLLNKLGLLKILYILNNCYSLGRPIGLRNCLPSTLMVLTKGGNLGQNTVSITTIE